MSTSTPFLMGNCADRADTAATQLVRAPSSVTADATVAVHFRNSRRVAEDIFHNPAISLITLNVFIVARRVLLNQSSDPTPRSISSIRPKSRRAPYRRRYAPSCTTAQTPPLWRLGYGIGRW